jgi:DNA-binding transcriptional LysR family regulator
MALVVFPGHPWTTRRPRLGTEFKAGPWVLREQGSGTRSIFEAALPDWGLEPRDLCVALELPSNETVRAAVEAGAGVTVISRLVARNAIKAGNLVAIEMPLPRRHFFALRHKERYVTKAEQAFLALISDMVKPPETAAKVTA